MKVPIILYIILFPLFLIFLVPCLIHTLITIILYPLWFVCIVFLEKRLVTFKEYTQWLSEGW